MKLFLFLSAIFLVFLTVSVLAEDQKCGENEEFQTCGTMCPDTCLNRNIKGRACVKSCKLGCACKHGFIRLGYDMMGNSGHCVELTRCAEIQYN